MHSSLTLNFLRMISREYTFVSAKPRVYLELQACLDYLKVYKPAMLLQLEEGIPSAHWLSTTARVMGAFTFDPLVCEWLYRARIPAWLIRPITELDSIRVVLAKEPRSYNQPLSGCHPLWPRHPPIFEGPQYSLEKYEALANHVLRLHSESRSSTIVSHLSMENIIS